MTRTAQIFAAVGWCVVSLLGAGCCDAWGQARSLAGSGAVDCGFVPIDADRAAALDCAEAAFLDGHAFVVGWEWPGRDTRVRSYSLMDAEGTAWLLGQNSDGSESRLTGNRCAGDFVRRDLGRPVGERFDCPTELPTVVFCE